MFLKRVIIILVLPLLFASSCKCSGDVEKELAPTNLKTNLVNDLCEFDIDDIRLSWQMNDKGSDEYQTAYKINIFQTKNKFENNDLIFTSNWVDSNENTSVKIEGLDQVLEYDKLYYWNVATKDKKGHISEYSEPKPFLVAPKENKSMRGIWASEGFNKSENDFCFLVTRFRLETIDSIEKAVLKMTATSPEPSRQFVYQSFVNGEFAGLGPTRVGRGYNDEDILYYNSFDITCYLNVGENVLGVFAYTTIEKNVFISIDYYDKEGTKVNIRNTDSEPDKFVSLEADDIFRKSNSIGTGYYLAHANNIDSTKYPFGFSKTSYNHSQWKQCYQGDDLTDNYILEPYYGEKIDKFFVNNESIKNQGDHILIDLGKEIIGGLSLQITSPQESNIEIRYGEQLDEDGRVKYHMLTHNIYQEKWKLEKGFNDVQNFSLMAYRYLEILGIDDSYEINSVKGISYHISWDGNDTFFDSNNELLNRIYELVRYTGEVTTQDLFVDSYSRERTAYEGDTFINQILCYSLQRNYSTSRFSLEWFYTKPTWPAEYTLLCSKMALLDYMYTGDSSSLERNYEILKSKSFDNYFEKEKGLITSGGERSYLIDWPECERDNYDITVYYNTVFNALHSKTYEELSNICLVLGKNDEATAYMDKSLAIKYSLIEKLYDNEDGCFSDGLSINLDKSSHYSAHATAYALYCGIYNSKDMRDRMVTYLTGDIKMSVYGTYFLLDGLYANGYDNIAYDILTNNSIKENASTYAYMLDVLGATICPEAWGPDHKDNMTFSHPWSAAPARAIINGVFGINPTEPGFSKFDISLRPGKLTNAKLRTPCIRGVITVEFDFDNRFVEVDIPANTEAKLYIPSRYCKSAKIDSKRAILYPGEDMNYLVIGSGKKTISLEY